MSTTQKSSPMLGLMAVVAAAYFLFAAGGGGGLKIPSIPDWLRPTPPAPTVPVENRFPEPAADLKALVAPLTAHLKANPAEAADVAGTYAALANFIERNPALVPTTASVFQTTERAALINGGKIGTPGTLPIVKAFLESQLGPNQPTPMDATKRSKVVACYRAIAWAAKEATKP